MGQEVGARCRRYPQDGARERKSSRVAGNQVAVAVKDAQGLQVVVKDLHQVAVAEIAFIGFGRGAIV
jgi:hypothetical protein